MPSIFSGSTLTQQFSPATCVFLIHNLPRDSYAAHNYNLERCLRCEKRKTRVFRSKDRDPLSDNGFGAQRRHDGNCGVRRTFTNIAHTSHHERQRGGVAHERSTPLWRSYRTSRRPFLLPKWSVCRDSSRLPWKWTLPGLFVRGVTSQMSYEVRYALANHVSFLQVSHK